MKTDKTTRYFKYAIGEIILVVIGILIALSINSWNQNRLERKKEKAILIEISNSIDSDLVFFEKILDFRLNIKKEGISRIMKMISEKDANENNDSLQFYFTKIQTDISINYDSGPYDALKSYGLEVISNDSLRKAIINKYEVLIPALKEFGDDEPSLLNPFIEKLKMDLFNKEPFQDETGKWYFKYSSKNKELLNNQNFYNLMDFELRKYDNYLSRLNYLRKEMIKLNTSIKKELNYLEHK